MIKTEEHIKSLTLARDCIDITYADGRDSYERLDKIINELKLKHCK